MTKDEKYALVDELTEKFKTINYFYITDTSGMTVAQINKFRRFLFDKGLEYKVDKNTLILKALERANEGVDYSEFRSKVLKGFSGIIFSPESGNLPAKLLKQYLKANPGEKPALKGASVDTALFMGADSLDALASLKSKSELIGDIVLMLQSPAQQVIGALQSGGQTISGVLKTLEERGA